MGQAAVTAWSSLNSDCGTINEQLVAILDTVTHLILNQCILSFGEEI